MIPDDLRLKLSIRLYMLSPPRAVRPSCEMEHSETFTVNPGHA